MCGLTKNKANEKKPDGAISTTICTNNLFTNFKNNDYEISNSGASLRQ